MGGGEGARAVSDLLMYNTRLGSLDLRGNGLGNDGVIFLSRGLRGLENPQLAELDLGYNEIKDDGACALAQVGARAGLRGWGCAAGAARLGLRGWGCGWALGREGLEWAWAREREAWRATPLSTAPWARQRRRRASPSSSPRQALKANAECAVKDLRLNNNYITKFGQVALSEAVDMVAEMGKGRVTTVHL